MTRERVYERSPDVRFRVVGDEGVILRQEAAEVVAVNDVGARIVSLLDDGRSLRDVLKTLLEEYDADEATLRADVERFVGELVEAGVVREAGT